MNKFFKWFSDWGKAMKVVNALDSSINQFPNLDLKKLDYLKSNKDFWQSDVTKKRIIDGYNKKVNYENVASLGDKYLNFYLDLFPSETGDEIKKKIEFDSLENFIFAKITNDDSLDPSEIEEIIKESIKKGIPDYDSVDKIRSKFEYYVVNWELDNGIFPNLSSDFILQKNEQCIFKNSSTEILERKQITKRVNYAGPRVRIKIAKGFSYNLGSYNVGVQKETVNVSRGNGTLNLTTKRLLFKSSEKNITITLSSIIDIEPYSNAVMISKSTGNPLIIKLSDGVQFYQYLNGAIKNL